jgi:hypothetical protein
VNNSEIQDNLMESSLYQIEPEDAGILYPSKHVDYQLNLKVDQVLLLELWL